LEQIVKFIKSKGPFPKGEAAMLVGNFNTDALINSEAKKGSKINDMLKDPVKFPLIAANKDKILNQYKDMITILSDVGNFKVTDTVFEKDKTHKPTHDICTFRQGEWVPIDIFYTDTVTKCSHQVLDYVF
jgi:hypothetical protein